MNVVHRYDCLITWSRRCCRSFPLITYSIMSRYGSEKKHAMIYVTFGGDFGSQSPVSTQTPSMATTFGWGPTCCIIRISCRRSLTCEINCIEVLWETEVI